MKGNNSKRLAFKYLSQSKMIVIFMFLLFISYNAKSQNWFTISEKYKENAVSNICECITAKQQSGFKVELDLILDCMTLNILKWPYYIDIYNIRLDPYEQGEIAAIEANDMLLYSCNSYFEFWNSTRDSFIIKYESKEYKLKLNSPNKLKSNQSDLDLLYKFVFLELSQPNYKKAKKILERIIELNANEFQALILLGFINEKKNRLYQASEYYLKAEKILIKKNLDTSLVELSQKICDVKIEKRKQKLLNN